MIKGIIYLDCRDTERLFSSSLWLYWHVSCVGLCSCSWQLRPLSRCDTVRLSEAVMEVTVTQPVSGPCQYQLHSNPSSRQSPSHLPQTPPRRSSCRDYRETLVKTTPGVKRTSSLQVHKAKRPVIGTSQGRDLDPSSAGRYSDTRLNIVDKQLSPSGYLDVTSRPPLPKHDHLVRHGSDR